MKCNLLLKKIKGIFVREGRTTSNIYQVQIPKISRKEVERIAGFYQNPTGREDKDYQISPQIKLRLQK